MASHYLPDALSKRAGGTQLTREADGTYRIEYGGSLGAEWGLEKVEALTRLAEWAEKEASRREMEARALRDISERCRFS